MILETVDLFLKLFPDQLQNSDSIQGFVQEVWTLVGSNKLPNISDDAVRVRLFGNNGFYLMQNCSWFLNPFDSSPALFVLDTTKPFLNLVKSSPL